MGPHTTRNYLCGGLRHIRISDELFHRYSANRIPYPAGRRRGFRRVLDDWAQRRIMGLNSHCLGASPPKTEVRTDRDSDDILIKRLCRPEWIDPEMSAKTKPGVIRDMVALAVTTDLLYDDAALQREIEERESVSSTAIGGGAAFLHARYHDPYYAADSFIVLGKTVQQIFFGAQDGEQTDLFFLICCTDDVLHLHVLARLCMLAHGTELLPDLRAATTAEEMYAILLNAELELLKAM